MTHRSGVNRDTKLSRLLAAKAGRGYDGTEIEFGEAERTYNLEVIRLRGTAPHVCANIMSHPPILRRRNAAGSGSGMFGFIRVSPRMMFRRTCQVVSLKTSDSVGFSRSMAMSPCNYARGKSYADPFRFPPRIARPILICGVFNIPLDS